MALVSTNKIRCHKTLAEDLSVKSFFVKACTCVVVGAYQELVLLPLHILTEEQKSQIREDKILNIQTNTELEYLWKYIIFIYVTNLFALHMQ